MAEQNLFNKLTQLFRSGPVVKRRIRSPEGMRSASTALETFKKAHSDIYNSTLSAYGSFDRMARYSDFSEMEGTPEIASALDIYAEETTSVGADDGRSLHIYSENQMIKDVLETLFYDVLNVEFNLVMWVRNLCKYGDFFLFNDIDPNYGIINAYPIPIAEIERQEGFDTSDPGAVRFRWISQGNKVLENWQVSHFRLLGNDAYLPYGSSILDPARRIWRQLILVEDAMLVYRIVRAPDRRVFYIDVGNIPPEEVENYLNQAQTSLKRNTVVDKNNGKTDLRYNALAVDEDYFLPVRGGESGTKIDTLTGGQNTAAIEDVEYIQKKLFAALKVPKAYLGYDEDIGSKATLAQEDIRFSRSIARIQKVVISELNKMAMIHLYINGYEGEDLLNFQLALSNPSSVAVQQKLNLIKTRFDIASQAPEGLVDRSWIQKNVMGFNNHDIEEIQEGKIQDKMSDKAVEDSVAALSAAASESDDPAAAEEAPAETEGGLDLFSGDLPIGDVLKTDGPKRQLEIEEEDEDEDFEMPNIKPTKPSNKIKNVFGGEIKKSRRVVGGALDSATPDIAGMIMNVRPQDSMNKPYGNINDGLIKEEADFEDNSNIFENYQNRIPKDIESMLNNMNSLINKNEASLLTEAEDIVEFVDLFQSEE
jgi:hypothetical protein